MGPDTGGGSLEPFMTPPGTAAEGPPPSPARIAGTAAETLDALVEAADAAMYLAKSRGKNGVVFAGEDRRSYSRAQVAVRGAYRALSAQYRSFVSLDVSEGGVSFETAEQVPSRALVDLKLRVPDLGRSVRCIGRVVRVRRHGERYLVAVSFLKISALGHRGLVRFVEQGTRSPRPTS